MEQMLAANDLRAILTAAEQAVARDDAAAAERLLRDALVLQESSAESPRDEVAKTLNNLAVVCEMTGKVADAETCYRRAYAIATATLPASDPFVTTSRENLEEFCKSQGIPFERPSAVAARAPSASAPAVSAPAVSAPATRASAPAASAPPVSAPTTAATPKPAAPVTAAPMTAAPMTSAPKPVPMPAPPRPAPLEPARIFSPPAQASRVAAPVPAPSTGLSRSIIFGALGVVALVAVMLGARSWFASGASPEQTASVSQPETAPTPAPAPAAIPAPPAAPAAAPSPETAREPEPAAREPKAAAPAPEPEPAAPAAKPAAPAATTRPEPARTAAPSAAPKVVSTQLCRSLSVSKGAWRCEAVSGTFGPGPLVFLTRVASTRDTVIEHRWYRGDSLHQRVELRIRANQTGFRTYSRTTVTQDRAGKWKVELRAADGRVLHEETFNVR